MNKNRKLLNILAGLGKEITVLSINEVSTDAGNKRIDISIDHPVYATYCPECGSAHIKKNGRDRRPSWAFHVPLGKRTQSRIIYSRQHFQCRDCLKRFSEDIPWVYCGSHMTVPLSECITDDLSTLMTKDGIARINRIPVYYVELVLNNLTPSIPSYLPEVMCLDETFSEVEETHNGKTRWVNFVTNLSDGETGELLDLLPFRTKKRLVHYFRDNFSYEERCKVRFLCCDMAEYYLRLVDECFPNAIVCLDNYHVTNRLLKGLSEVRSRQQDYLLSLSKAKNDPYYKAASDLKHLSHKLVTAAYNHSSFWGKKYEAYVSRIRQHLMSCPELKDAYAMLQYFYIIFHLQCSYESKVRDLDLWISVFGKSTSETIRKTVGSVSDHLKYIHNAWKNGYSNATCEGNNNVIQTLKDMSFGIHSFEYFRSRALLIAGKPRVTCHASSDSGEALDCTSFFFDEFPALQDYVLAYDWTNPHVDMSTKGV